MLDKPGRSEHEQRRLAEDADEFAGTGDTDATTDTTSDPDPDHKPDRDLGPANVASLSAADLQKYAEIGYHVVNGRWTCGVESSDPTQAIHLGGEHGVEVESLDSLKRQKWDAVESLIRRPVSSADPGISCDWSELLRLAGFDAEETKLVITNRIEQVPRTGLTKALRWKSRRVERVRKRAARKLKAIEQRVKMQQTVQAAPAAPSDQPIILQEDPSRTVQQTRLNSGVTFWEFRPSKTE